MQRALYAGGQQLEATIEGRECGQREFGFDTEWVEHFEKVSGEAEAGDIGAGPRSVLSDNLRSDSV